jgi:hypothetical protein
VRATTGLGQRCDGKLGGSGCGAGVGQRAVPGAISVALQALSRNWAHSSAASERWKRREGREGTEGREVISGSGG